MDFGWFNWTLVGLATVGILGLSLYCRRYIRDVADFLSAGRVAGRYVICVGSMEEALGIIALVQMMERNYTCGFAIAFWNITIVALNMIINLSGWCTYRFRETRAMSLGQFLEIRYDRAIRIVASVIRATADILTEILLPSLAARFFIYFFDLPFAFRIGGCEVSTYVVIMLLTLSIALFIICSGGSVALLVADCVQGLLCYPLFFMIVAFALLTFSWGGHIAPTLLDRVPGESFLNPFDVYNLRNFNIFMIFVLVFSNVMNRAIWLGSGFSTSAKSAHEQKMAGVLGIWRGGFSGLMLTMLGVMMIVMMNHKDFSAMAQKTRVQLSEKIAVELMPQELRPEFAAAVGSIPEQKHEIGVPPLSQKRNLDTVYLDAARTAFGKTGESNHKFQQFRTFYSQLMFPVAMRNLMPRWLLGMLMLLAVMLMISTDCSRIFMIAAGIAQDLVLPFLKKPMATKHQLWMIRTFAVLVAVIFFFGSLFMAQVDYIQLFIVSVGALWTGGAGAMTVFGLYSRFGNTAGAFASLIGGSGFSLVGWLVSHNWANHVYPWLERHGRVPALSRFFEVVSAPFHPYVVWEMNPTKFPINAYERLFIALLISIVCYVVASLIAYRKPFDLEKMLHRGEYADDKSICIRTKWSFKTVFSKLIGITPEYSKSDRIIARGVFTYTFIYRFLVCFVLVLMLNSFVCRWTPEYWSVYYLITLIIVPSIVGVVSTVWFSVGGFIDLKNMFRDLAARKRDFTDDGRVNKKD